MRVVSMRLFSSYCTSYDHKLLLFVCFPARTTFFFFIFLFFRGVFYFVLPADVRYSMFLCVLSHPLPASDLFSLHTLPTFVRTYHLYRMSTSHSLRVLHAHLLHYCSTSGMRAPRTMYNDLSYLRSMITHALSTLHSLRILHAHFLHGLRRIHSVSYMRTFCIVILQQVCVHRVLFLHENVTAHYSARSCRVSVRRGSSWVCSRPTRFVRARLSSIHHYQTC